MNSAANFEADLRNTPVPGTRWGAIFAGAFITLGLCLLFALLGAALGLSLFDNPEVRQNLSWGSALLGGLGLFLCFFIGALATAKLAFPATRATSVFQGMAMWSLAVVGVTAFAAITGASVLTNSLRHLGLGAIAAEQASITLKQFQKLNPRVVSDVKLKDGEVVSRLETDKPVSQAAEVKPHKLSKELQKEGGKLAQKAEKQLAEARDEISTAGWAAFGTLFLSLLASIGGALSGSPRTPPRREARRAYKAAA